MKRYLKGIVVNRDFLEPEVRSGYYVSREVKELWAVQLDLLQYFDDICRKNNLSYYAQGGTLLGAARHKGFIPWDDDVDVMMLWEDYRKLIELVPDQLEEPYFLQSYLTEREAEPTFARLRRSDTTGCTKFELECITPPYNKGIFIDIFPLFDVPDNEVERKKQIEDIIHWWKLYKGYEVHREKQLNGRSRLESSYERYEEEFLLLEPAMTFDEIREHYIEACSACSSETSRVAPLSFRADNPKTTWPREWFDSAVSLPFEFISISAPSAYVEMLDHQYGDWKVPVQGGSMHEMGIFDAHVPYTQKLDGTYVRGYFSSDYPDLAALLNEEYNSDVTAQEIEDHYLSSDKNILVAIREGVLVGCVFISINEDFIRRGKTLFVSYVAVRQDMRRMGIGSALSCEIERKARSYDCDAIELTSANWRTAAHEFYLSRGFTKKKTTVFIKDYRL